MRWNIQLAVLTATVAGLTLASVGVAQECAVGGACAPCDAGCTKTVCRRVDEKKTVSKRNFDDRCEKFCVPCHGINHCKCGKVCTRKQLILFVKKHDECDYKCVPVEVPVGQGSAACQECAPSVAAVCPGCTPSYAGVSYPTNVPMQVMQPGQPPAITTMPSTPIQMPIGK